MAAACPVVALPAASWPFTRRLPCGKQKARKYSTLQVMPTQATPKVTSSGAGAGFSVRSMYSYLHHEVLEGKGGIHGRQGSYQGESWVGAERLGMSLSGQSIQALAMDNCWNKRRAIYTGKRH